MKGSCYTKLWVIIGVLLTSPLLTMLQIFDNSWCRYDCSMTCELNEMILTWFLVGSQSMILTMTPQGYRGIKLNTHIEFSMSWYRTSWHLHRNLVVIMFKMHSDGNSKTGQPADGLHALTTCDGKTAL